MPMPRAGKAAIGETHIALKWESISRDIAELRLEGAEAPHAAFGAPGAPRVALAVTARDGLLTGLKPATAYDIRLVARLADGSEVTGPTCTVDTKPPGCGGSAADAERAPAAAKKRGDCAIA
jgi:hypothetical protein